MVVLLLYTNCYCSQRLPGKRCEFSNVFQWLKVNSQLAIHFLQKCIEVHPRPSSNIRLEKPLNETSSYVITWLWRHQVWLTSSSRTRPNRDFWVSRYKSLPFWRCRPDNYCYVQVEVSFKSFVCKMYIKILSVCVNGSSSFATVCFVCTIIDMWIYWYNFSLQNSLNEKG